MTTKNNTAKPRRHSLKIRSGVRAGGIAHSGQIVVDSSDLYKRPFIITV